MVRGRGSGCDGRIVDLEVVIVYATIKPRYAAGRRGISVEGPFKRAHITNLPCEPETKERLLTHTR